MNISIHLAKYIFEDNGTQKVSPKLKKIIGAVSLPKGFDEEKELRSYLENKHL